MAIGAVGEEPGLKLADPGDGRQELTEHLSELRGRLIRSAVYIVVGMIVMYAIFPWLFKFLSAPILTALQEIASKVPPDQRTLAGAFVFHNFFEMFFLRLQLSLIAGIIVAAPFITIEVWGFVTPALTAKERRSVRFVAPFSAFLFLLGAALAFFIMPAAIHWFLLYLADFPGAVLLQDPQDYILFLFKMILAFGLVFQLPVIMMGLGRFGIIRSRMLTKYWRYIVVGISVAAMIITPSNDPFSMIVMTVPLIVLFFLSIWLVKLVEPKTP
jgi:sec-independent protein translocase protein TatC